MPEYRYCVLCKGKGTYTRSTGSHGGLCDCQIGELPAKYYSAITGWQAEALSKWSIALGMLIIPESRLPALQELIDILATEQNRYIWQEAQRPWVTENPALTIDEFLAKVIGETDGEIDEDV